MAAPLPANESERLRAIRRYAILDTPREVAFDRITRLAARLLNVPIVLVTITDQERNWFKSACGTDVPETSRELSFCAHAILTDEPTIVPDLSRDRRFASHTLVTGQPYIRFYAGAPLRTSGGLNLGTLCALDLQPRELTSDERVLLQDLAAIVMDELDLRLAILEGNQKSAAISNMSLGVVVTDPNQADNPIIYCNPAFSAMTGYPPDEVMGRNCRFLQGPETDPAALDEMRSALSERRVTKGVLLNYRKNAEPFWSELTICPVIDKDQRLVNFVGIQNDVTDRILKEKALQQSYDKLKELEDLRDNLTSMIVHDMRSPLCATMGFLELLREAAEGKDNDEDISYIESAADSAKELNAMITSLLDVKRLEAGEMPLCRVVCDLRDVAKAAIKSFAELVGKDRLILEAPREAVQTRCDPAIVSRVIANLVNNALKFTPNDGRVRVIIAQEGGRARLSVRDTGSGISIEHHAKIFEKFGQVTGHQTEHSTGLGLTFCKLAIETHGGSIGVESELGQGSDFWFLLPGPSISDCN